MVVNGLIPLELWKGSQVNKTVTVSFQQQDYPSKVVGVGNQASINNNNPAVTLQVKSKANGQLATGLPVKNSIADN